MKRREVMPGDSSARRVRRGAGGAAAMLAVAALVVGWFGSAAGAHSFLVSTTPAQGERLGDSPDAAVLEFSEVVDPASVSVTVTTLSGEVVADLPVETVDGGLAVRAVMPALDDGVFLVSWEALSALDGHGTAGEFAFAVGSVDASIPAASTSAPTDAAAVGAGWLFVAGVAAAAGAMIVALVAATPMASAIRVGRLGLIVAGSGALLAAIVSSSSGLAALLVLQALLLGLIVIGFARPWWTLMSIGVATALWSTRSHGADNGTLGWALDVVHLGTSVAWLGSLAFVVVTAAALRHRNQPWMPLIASYATPALGFVVVLGLAGTVAAWRLVPSWDDLWTTRYGQLVVAKTGLFTLAVGAAAIARLQGLGRQRSLLLKRAIGVELPLVAGAALLAGVLTATAPPSPVSAAELLGPTPMTGQVSRDAGLAGNLTVNIVSDGDRLDVGVFVGSGPVPGTEISVSVIDPSGTEIDLVPRPCGTGCLTQALALTGGSTKVRVSATAPNWTGGFYEGTLAWPPGELAPQQLRSVIETMRAVPELSLTETVDSGPGSLVSPAVFTISGRRLIEAEPYAAGNVEEVRMLTGPTEGLSVYVPGSQFYAELELDDQDRIISARMVDPGHLITRTITYPDE